MAPVHDFGFVDPEARVVCSSEAWSCADGTIHIDHDSASSANEVVVVVADAVFIQGRGANRLNAPNESLLCEHPESVVDRLTRNCPDLCASHFHHAVGGDMGLFRHGTKHSKALGGDLEPVRAKNGSGIRCHGTTI
jgi:hypothetical protein